MDVWLCEKEMRSKEIRDTYQLHITVPSGTPACSGDASVFSNSSLSAPVTALSPEDSAAPPVFSGEAHSVFPLFLLPYHCGFQSICLSSFKNPRSDETHDFYYVSSTVQQSPPFSPTFIKYFSAQLSPFLQLLPCHCFIPRSHSTTQSICAYASLSPPFSSVCLSHFFFLLPKPVSPSHFSPQCIVPLSTITMSKNLGVILDSSLLVVQSTCQSC